MSSLSQKGQNPTGMYLFHSFIFFYFSVISEATSSCVKLQLFKHYVTYVKALTKARIHHRIQSHSVIQP